MITEADEKLISPHFPCGIVSPEDLIRLGKLAAETPGCKIKITGTFVLGIEDPEQRDLFRKKMGFRQASVAGLCVRPVKACAGDYICPNSQQSILPLARRIDSVLSGMETPFKLLISISGCGRCCSEPKVSDIGIVAARDGFSVYTGGAAGANPRTGTLLASKVKATEIEPIINGIIEIYKTHATAGTRLGQFIDKLGFDAFKNRVMERCGNNKPSAA